MNFCGGIIGDAATSGVTVSDDYNLGTVTGTTNSVAGGIAGDTYGIVTRVYDVGVVSGSSAGNFGSDVGWVRSGATLSDSFYNQVTSGVTGVGSSIGTVTNDTGGCFGSTSCTGGTVDMTQQTTYASAPYSWNFSTTWQIVNGKTYPFFIGGPSTRIIAGTTPVAGGITVSIAADG